MSVFLLNLDKSLFMIIFFALSTTSHVGYITCLFDVFVFRVFFVLFVITEKYQLQH